MNDRAPAPLRVVDLGLTDYATVFDEMRRFTDERVPGCVDELWFTQHRPVFTQGQAGKAEHVLAPGDIPVVQTDRGGQVTYHGPGQIVGYLMFDLRALGLGPRSLVRGIERAVSAVLRAHGIDGRNREDAPGVYVDGTKIASLGLRIRRGCSYHGLSLNVAMDLEPFARINPCGLTNVAVTDMASCGAAVELPAVQAELETALRAEFGFVASDQ